MKGKQLKGLVKVLAVFNDIFDARRNDVANNEHTLYCVITPKSGDIFGIPMNGMLNIDMLAKLDLDLKADYDVSVENDSYVLSSDKERIIMDPFEGKAEGLKTNTTKYDKYTDSFVVLSTELKQAVKRLNKLKPEYVDITKGGLQANRFGVSMNIILKESECESLSKFRMSLLKKVVDVTSGYVMVSYGQDALLNLKWSDEYYEYNAFIAGCFLNDD